MEQANLIMDSSWASAFSRQGQSVCFDREDTTLIFDGVGFALFRVASAVCSCDFIVGHAPHAARSPEERTECWSQVDSAVCRRKYAERFQLFSLLDASASFGSSTSTSVASNGCDRQCDDGTHFHRLPKRTARYCHQLLPTCIPVLSKCLPRRTEKDCEGMMLVCPCLSAVVFALRMSTWM